MRVFNSLTWIGRHLMSSRPFPLHHKIRKKYTKFCRMRVFNSLMWIGRHLMSSRPFPNLYVFVMRNTICGQKSISQFILFISTAS